MRHLLFFGLMLLLSQIALAQNEKNISTPITLDSLVYKNIQKHKAEQTLDGFRVQLFSSADRNSVNALRTKFKTEYPEVPAYLIYQQPYFKLRVGDFRNQIEAQLFYLELQKNYGQLLIVPDKINLPTL
ncbi:MAG: SPOR domain-containing protein [Bacteroidetes bacterium]|jgi:hypothetical protein|nr:SPOR domain-containing protein [Bacteroidota bacterium]